MFDTISVIGLGYIGLPTATLFASRKIKVIGVDISPTVVEAVNRGELTIVEPDLDMLVKASVGAGYLRAVTSPEPADVFLITVPTPLKDDKKPDLACIRAAISSIAPVMRKGNLVILESTSPVGTTERMADWLAELRPDLTFPNQVGENSDIRISYCPERVLPGRIVHELVSNDRVIGGMTPKCSQVAIELYKLFVRGKCIVTDTKAAEMCKLAENSFRDINIAFANELSMICDEQDIDVWELIQLANRHPRVNILQPGCGVGGHCIAIDPWFIVDGSPEQSRLIRTAREVNDSKSEWVVDKVDQAVTELEENGFDTANIQIACLGLTFKPDINDLRESPALHITETLVKRYPGRVKVVEPNIVELPETLSNAQLMIADLEDVKSLANILVLLVDHIQFERIKAELSPKQSLIDTRGIWSN